MSVILYAFVTSSVLGLFGLWYDLKTTNNNVPSLMRLVWTLTIAYSGLVGLAIYWYTGRKNISFDSDYRRAARSTAHCYSGCGLGEIIGVMLAVAFFSGTTIAIATGSFAFAYILGFALTIGPLIQEGETFSIAFKDALSTETASITVMETAAVSADVLILNTGDPSLTAPLFWIALFVSLTIGYVAAYPVNLMLIKMGVKEGMMNPQHY